MKHYRFVDLGITSTKKPFNTHLWWEHATYGLFMVDSTDQTVLLFSTIARLLVDGSDWDIVDLSDNANSYKIQSGYLDGNDLWLIMCDNDGTADDFEVCFIELDDSNDCNPIGVSAGADANSVYAYDIWVYDGNTYAFTKRDVGGAGWVRVIVWDVDTHPFTLKDKVIDGSVSGDYDKGSFGATVGDNFYFTSIIVSSGSIIIYYYDHSGTDLLQKNFIAGYDLPSRNQQGLAYDGSNLIYLIGNKTADGKDYLITYSISGNSFIVYEEYNIALMLDRNNSGVAPNEFEKAFSIGASETVYEIKARLGGIRVLQDISAITDAVIIAITDNFLMNDDGDMFEFTDVTNEISSIRYTGGIMGILKVGTFIVHPDFHINWNEGDSIKIYDQYDQLEFHGLITNKNRNARGIYVYKIDSFTNEIYRKTYEKAYSGDDSDTKQKDIIDNACDFCYRSSSIVGTTTNYDYDYNRAIIYLFWLNRFLERQVPYIEPDGKIWTKAHDGLAKNPLIYPGTYSFKDDDDGDEPSGWTVSNDADCSTTIIASFNNHKKVLKLVDENAAGTASIFRSVTQQADQTIELWIAVSDITTTTGFVIQIHEDATRILQIRVDNNDLDYWDGAWKSINDNFIVVNTLIRIKLIFDDSNNQYDIYVDGTLEVDNAAYENNTTTGINKIQFNTGTGDILNVYVDAIGLTSDPAYTVGDNEVAWELSNHWQEVFLIDIPGLEEKIQGFFSGNSGITRNTIRYKDNTTAIRPVAATRDPIEQLQGIIPLNEFRDTKIEEATEANQLGDNRYSIWSSDIIFLGLKIEGQGYLLPGKTVEIENTGEITIPKNDYLILSFERDPKNDIYTRMILSDNIIFPKEFNNLHNTSPQQIHTSTVQSFQNQADIIAHLTPEGGLALRLTNKTGAASVKGTLVEADTGIDNAFKIADASSNHSIAAVYEDGIADGDECLIVIGGRVQVLLKDATASTRGNWVKVSDVAGRADATGATPAAAPTHFLEVGHCIESKGADTDVLAFIMMHFL